jgi:hypothetical protein
MKDLINKVLNERKIEMENKLNECLNKGYKVIGYDDFKIKDEDYNNILNFWKNGDWEFNNEEELREYLKLNWIYINNEVYLEYCD